MTDWGRVNNLPSREGTGQWPSKVEAGGGFEDYANDHSALVALIAPLRYLGRSDCQVVGNERTVEFLDQWFDAGESSRSRVVGVRRGREPMLEFATPDVLPSRFTADLTRTSSICAAAQQIAKAILEDMGRLTSFNVLPLFSSYR